MSEQQHIERIDRMVKLLREVTGIDFTFGYLGNTYGIPDTPAYEDDRIWYVFATHPGRVGTHADRIGGYRTNELECLVPELVGALKLATIMKERAS